MQLSRLGPMFFLLLTLSGGQTIFMVGQADATCCSIWEKGCTRWSHMVHGSAERLDEEGTKFRIEDDKGNWVVVPANQDIAQAFKNENGGKGIKKDYGFSILTQQDDEVRLIGFVPNTKDHTKTRRGGVKAVVADWNKLFAIGANKPSSYHK